MDFNFNFLIGFLIKEIFDNNLSEETAEVKG